MFIRSNSKLEEAQAAQLDARDLLQKYSAAQQASSSGESPPDIHNWFRLLDTFKSDTASYSNKGNDVNISLSGLSN